jgi:hypothetical protein
MPEQSDMSAEGEVAANLEPGFDNIQILTFEQCSGCWLELHPANAAVGCI